MTDDIDAKIIQSFAADIHGRLNAAAVIACLADGFGKEGLTERALKSSFEIEPQIRDTATMLQASSLARRRDRNRRDEFD